MPNNSLSMQRPSAGLGADTHDDPMSTMLSNSVTLDKEQPQESEWKISDFWNHITDESMRTSAMLLLFALLLGLIVGFILNSIF